jgi:hypothetical protein
MSCASSGHITKLKQSIFAPLDVYGISPFREHCNPQKIHDLAYFLLLLLLGQRQHYKKFYGAFNWVQ